ncbi:MAG: aspartate kinase [Flavobacteriaceae bacterium]|nr:aspartate kinase [Flavobacteriaceae bacterium]MDG2314003.1 aspartate kinase [Flavobacteriaceae bacterium]
MKIFKFGGASVKDANGIKNLVEVLQKVGHKDTLVVVSAMGKTTNALEKIVQNYFDEPSDLKYSIQEVVKYHNTVLLDLFESDQHTIFKEVKSIFDNLQLFFEHNKSPNYSFVYDQTVSCGELASTKIISAYLNEVGIINQWLDARNCIKTDSYHRDANLDWEATQKNISNQVAQNKLYVTQGFIGSEDNNFTTTLGREGSDYSAAIFAYCLNADSVTIWKDVPGVLNADPRYFENTQLLHQISYREAIELAFYGASVIHPKTLQPLQRKEIPLYVKSFINPKEAGTTVGKGNKIKPDVPCFIVKKDLVLIKLSSLDFSFIVEKNISSIFKLLDDHKMKVDVIQNSAISFSVCVNDKYEQLESLIQELKATFKVTCTEGVDLFTIRHFNSNSESEILKNKEVLLEQRTQNTLQLVVK